MRPTHIRRKSLVANLAGKIAWVTGAGSGIGQAAALALAEDGATVILTGRTPDKLENTARRIHNAGQAHVQPADLTDKEQVRRVGVNILDRHWDKLTPESIDIMVQGNLTAALYCVTVALPFMGAQQDGLIIHTASMAGRFIGGVAGPIYVTAKHGIVAMTHGRNMEECVNGVRATVFLPGEVATPILDQRPNPVPPEVRARMVQPVD